jgi:hypothetical protein
LVDKLESNITPENVVLGCPLNNLSQEMSPLDEGFRVRLASITSHMQQMAVATLAEGLSDGLFAPWVQPEATAWQLLCTIEGAFGLAKVQGDVALFGIIMRQFVASLQPVHHQSPPTS